MPSVLDATAEAFEIVEEGPILCLFITIPTIRERQATILDERLACLCERGTPRIAVGLAPVVDLCTAAIATLMRASRRCGGSGGSLALFSPSKEIRRILHTTGLAGSLTICADQREAVRVLSGGAPARRFFGWKRAA